MHHAINASFIAIIGCLAVPAAVDHISAALALSQPSLTQYSVPAVGRRVIGADISIAERAGVNRAFGI